MASRDENVETGWESVAPSREAAMKEIPDSLLHVQSVWDDAEQKDVMSDTRGKGQMPAYGSQPRTDR